MQIKRCVCLGCLLFLFMASYSFALTIHECIKIGLKNNPHLKSLDYLEKTREQDVKERLTAFFPDISLSYSNEEYHKLYQYNTTEYDNKIYNNITFSIIQNIFAGFADLSSYQQAKLQKEVFLYQKKSEILNINTS